MHFADERTEKEDRSAWGKAEEKGKCTEIYDIITNKDAGRDWGRLPFKPKGSELRVLKIFSNMVSLKRVKRMMNAENGEVSIAFK